MRVTFGYTWMRPRRTRQPANFRPVCTDAATAFCRGIRDARRSDDDGCPAHKPRCLGGVLSADFDRDYLGSWGRLLFRQTIPGGFRNPWSVERFRKGYEVFLIAFRGISVRRCDC